MEPLRITMDKRIHITGWNSLSHTCGDLQDGFIEQCQPLDAPYFVPAGSSFKGHYSGIPQSTSVQMVR